MGRNGYEKISTDNEKENVSFVSLLFFRWMNKTFTTGSERALDENDLLPLSKENSASFLTEKLQENWDKERKKCAENGKRPKLWKSVIRLLSAKDTVIIVLCSTLWTLSRVLQPLFLGYIISKLISTQIKKETFLYGCAVAMCINTFLGSLAMHQNDYRGELLGIRISSALKGLVYRKVRSTNKIRDS